MGRPRELTKEELIKYGITNCTEDGHVYTRLGEVNYIITGKKSRYKTQLYRNIVFYSPVKYVENLGNEKYNQMGNVSYRLSRVIWAWFKGVCPANLDVDHINNDSLDDRLDNYQLLTRAENLKKRRGHLNQWESSLRE